MRLSKAVMKAHEEAEEILKKDLLTNDEQHFVLDNWHPGARHLSGKTAAFFTPKMLARDLATMCYGQGKGVDLCAGIGRLTRALLDFDDMQDITSFVCIELNPDYVAVGQKVVPEATWVTGSILDEEMWADLGQFDFAISNPPFGNIGKDREWRGYRGPMDLMAMAVALDVTKVGVTAIMPQGSCPFRYSGMQMYTEQRPTVYERFKKSYPEANFTLQSVDASFYKDDWVDVAPSVELVHVMRGE